MVSSMTQSPGRLHELLQRHELLWSTTFDVTSASFTINGVGYTGEAWTVHENWDSDDIDRGYDLALVKLSSRLTVWYGLMVLTNLE